MNARNFAVGLFVAVAVSVFIFTTVWLTGKQGSQPTVTYSMFFERDVSGLMLGGPVYYMGVAVGTVTAMEIIPADRGIINQPTRVRVDADVLKSAPINAGTYASLALQGITGVAVIKLNSEHGLQGDMETDADTGNPVISVRDSGFGALLAKAPDILEKMDNILVQINQLLGPENREFVSEILGDLASVSGALATRDETISELPVMLKNTLAEIDSSLVHIRNMTGDMQPGLSAIIVNLEKTSSSLAEMAGRLESWATTNDGDMNAFMEGGLGQVPALVSDARASLREIEKLIRDLRENPSSLIYKPNEDAIDVEQ